MSEQGNVLNALQLDRIAQESVDKVKSQSKLIGTCSRKIRLLVTVALALHFSEDVDAVVVTKGSRHFVVVHRRMVFLNAPKASQSGRIGDFEDARFAILPGDVVRITLARIVEQLLQEVPEKSSVGSGIQAVSGASGQSIRFVVVSVGALATIGGSQGNR